MEATMKIREYDDALDTATYAVIDAFRKQSTEEIDSLSDDERTELLEEINDALNAVMAERFQS
jgi:uncharacterized membrane protein YukC